MGPDMVGVSDATTRVFHLLVLASLSCDPILLLGESGTGKELAARAIHDLGADARGPFVPMNMAALPPDLAEAELFGWVRGSFTGASSSQAGAFESARDGTIFLDEIGEARPDVQVKLLRAVDTGTVNRIGSRRQVHLRTRIIAATNRDPASEIERGRFRLDLLQRLSCLVVRLPPLADRPDDIPVIARKLCMDLPGQPFLEREAERVLAVHEWQGNVRELKNVVRRAAVFSMNGALTVSSIQEALDTGPMSHGAGIRKVAWTKDAVIPGRVTRSHQIALSGLPRSTFYYRLKKGQIEEYWA